MPQLSTTIEKIAEFLGAQKGDITQLLQEGRLDGALLAKLNRRGVAVTPSLKNSVRTLVKEMEPPRIQAGPGAQSPTNPESESTATIMFTDIVGSTDMMGRLGDRQGRLVFSRHDRIIRQIAAAHNGLEVKSMGDGFMLAFRSARRAVASALARIHRRTPMDGVRAAEGGG